MRSLILGQILAFGTISAARPAEWGENDLFIRTENLAVQGRLSNITDTVRFFGNIPYAESPIGEFRFRSPIAKIPSSEVIDGRDFGPSCIQLNTGSKTVYTEYLSGFLLRPGQQTSEDCLTVNIWTPRAASISKPLPVMVWIHGGGFTSGGSASPYKYGDYLIRDHQDVIMVAMNYRLNIFGFPGAAALGGEHLNPGLEDQRMAVEWVSQNIHAFGGDPDKMILFGQSAGGSSVDKYYYAYPNNPLIQGFIPQSGMADGGPDAPPGTTNFSYVASQLGCVGDDSVQFGCMQKVDANSIINIVNTYNGSLNGGKSLSFGPQADELTSFADYDERRKNGQFAQKPSIISQVNNEGASLLAYKGPNNPPNQTVVDQFTCNFATFPGDKGALARQKFDLPLWRTRYFGVWPNLNPLSWLGAYHSSDLPMIFGTHALRGPSTDIEIAASAYYQAAWVAFAKDPMSGLKNYGWPEYNAETGDNLIQLGYGGSIEAVVGSSSAFEEHCNAVIDH